MSDKSTVIESDTLAARALAAYRMLANGEWYPANGGTEEPFNTRTGRRLLYCWQPSTGRHAYLDMGSDMILSDEEASVALGM